jgi:hypothetical protein
VRIYDTHAEVKFCGEDQREHGAPVNTKLAEGTEKSGSAGALGGVEGYCAQGPGFVGDLGVAGGGDGGG